VEVYPATHIAGSPQSVPASATEDRAFRPKDPLADGGLGRSASACARADSDLILRDGQRSVQDAAQFADSAGRGGLFGRGEG
jgi:hypothetical protein